jgi:hypothetical protein
LRIERQNQESENKAAMTEIEDASTCARMLKGPSAT